MFELVEVLIAKIMGEGKKEKAQKIFSLLIMATIICGIVIGAISIIFLRPVAVFLEQEERCWKNVLYMEELFS